MILLLAPDTPERLDTAGVLKQLGHQVASHLPGTGIVPESAQERVDAILLDLASGQDALKFLRRHLNNQERAPVVCIADRRRLDASAEALRLGAVDIIGRPVKRESVAAALGNAREFSRLTRELPIERGEETPDGVFGASPAMREVLHLARRVGPSRCPVLVIGERGTGREMVARAIHGAGSRAGDQFHKVSCPGVSEAELADMLGGVAPFSTIYLENLSELSAPAQLRLEELLKQASSDNEPGFQMARADGKPLRFIAGAQPRIWTWMERGVVRRELVDSLSVVRIDLPSLRQRVEDIPLLAMHFLKIACEQNDVPLKTFSRSAATLLASLPWPGNATELRSLCDRLAVLVPRGVVLLEDVLENVRFDGAEAIGRSRDTLKVARDRFEREYITAVLQQHKGRMGTAAKELGIERTNLYRKIKQLGIRWAGDLD